MTVDSMADDSTSPFAMFARKKKAYAIWREACSAYQLLLLRPKVTRTTHHGKINAHKARSGRLSVSNHRQCTCIALHFQARHLRSVLYARATANQNQTSLITLARTAGLKIETIQSARRGLVGQWTTPARRKKVRAAERSYAGRKSPVSPMQQEKVSRISMSKETRKTGPEHTFEKFEVLPTP